MKTYEIYIDGKPYLGEDFDKTYPANIGNSNGWNMRNHGELNMLKLGSASEAPKMLTGWRGINGAIERISRRLKAGVIGCDKIEIYVGDDDGL